MNFSHFAPPVCTYRRHIFNYRCEIIRWFTGVQIFYKFTYSEKRDKILNSVQFGWSLVNLLLILGMRAMKLIDTRNESHETDASVVADSFISESPILTETIDVYSANAPYKRKVSPTNAEEFNHPSTSRKKLVIMIFLIGHNFYSLHVC